MVIFNQEKEKKNNAVFFLIGILMLFLLLGAFFLFFFPKFNNISPMVVRDFIKKPDIEITFTVIDSEQVKNLEPFLSELTEVPQGKSEPFIPYY